VSNSFLRNSDDKIALLEESIEGDWQVKKELSKSIASSKHNTKTKFGSIAGRRESAVSVEMPYITEPTLHDYYQDAPIVRGGSSLPYESATSDIDHL
jgi:hypothetical protein